jgi:hypothetical protein
MTVLNIVNGKLQLVATKFNKYIIFFDMNMIFKNVLETFKFTSKTLQIPKRQHPCTHIFKKHYIKIMQHLHFIVHMLKIIKSNSQ